MGVWTRDEIEREWLKYQKSARACGPAGNWDPFCDLYTEDATMVVSGGIEVGGREAMKKWYREALGADPMRSLHYYPVEWYMIDEHRGWISCQFWNRMADPGDGSPYVLNAPPNVAIGGGALIRFNPRGQLVPAVNQAINIGTLSLTVQGETGIPI